MQVSGICLLVDMHPSLYHRENMECGCPIVLEATSSGVTKEEATSSGGTREEVKTPSCPRRMTARVARSHQKSSERPRPSGQEGKE